MASHDLTKPSPAEHQQMDRSSDPETTRANMVRAAAATSSSCVAAGPTRRLRTDRHERDLSVRVRLT